MPYTKLQEKARAKYITPKQFAEQFQLSKSRTYQILALPEMQEALFKTGEKSLRINQDRAYEIIRQLYN